MSEPKGEKIEIDDLKIKFDLLYIYGFINLII